MRPDFQQIKSCRMIPKWGGGGGGGPAPTRTMRFPNRWSLALLLSSTLSWGLLENETHLTALCTRPLPPPHSPTHHIPPLIPPTADGDPIPVNSPPPPPARYPTSPQVVVRTGAGRAANGLLGPPKGGLPGQNN